MSKSKEAALIQTMYAIRSDCERWLKECEEGGFPTDEDEWGFRTKNLVRAIYDAANTAVKGKDSVK